MMHANTIGNPMGMADSVFMDLKTSDKAEMGADSLGWYTDVKGTLEYIDLFPAHGEHFKFTRQFLVRERERLASIFGE